MKFSLNDSIERTQCQEAQDQGDQGDFFNSV